MYIYIYAGTKIKTPDIYIFSPKIWLDFIFKTMEIDEISCVTGNKKPLKNAFIYLSFRVALSLLSLSILLHLSIHIDLHPPSYMY